MAYTMSDTRAKVLYKIAESLVGPQVKNHFISLSDKKDYIQDLLRDFVLHQEDWTVPAKVKFETFATTVMKRRMISLWRAKHKNHDILHDAKSLNDLQKDDADEDYELLDDVAADGTLNNSNTWIKSVHRFMDIVDVRFFLASVSTEERELCEMLEYYDVEDISKRLRVSRTVIVRRINQIRRKMIEYGFERFSKKIQKKFKKGVSFFKLFATNPGRETSLSKPMETDL